MKFALKMRYIKMLSTAVFAGLTVISFQNCSSSFRSGGRVFNADFSSVGTPDPALVAAGTKLYANSCAACHNPLTNSHKFNRTAAQIKDAIANVGSMSHLKNLTDAELNSIAQALLKSQNVAANPFTCNGETGTSVLRRLTKREYTNTLMDLFAGQLSSNDIGAELANIPLEFTNHLPSVRVFDSTNPTSISFPMMNAFVDISTKAADVIIASTTKMNALGGACISGAGVSDVCVYGFIDSFGMRAYRRPLTAEERTSLFSLYYSGTASPDRMARVIQALILSPNFLFKLENNGTSVDGRADLLKLNGYEVASRLSYGIFGSMPDQALFDAAKSGALSTSAGVQQQAERLFALSKAKEGVRSFYSQWLRLNYIPNIQTSAAFAAGLNLATLRAESSQEVSDIMDHLIWTKNATFRELMTTSLAIPRTSNLASIYGVPVSNQLVELDHPMRKGILTRVGLLALDSIGKSNPIKRGVNARVHMLCDNMGAPPADTEMAAHEVDLLSSTRDQVTTKTAAAQCMACHGRINPAGFAFENFDGLGRYRTSENITHNGVVRTHPINSVVSPNINAITDPQANGAAEYQTAIADSPVGQACFAKQWVQYNTGRDVSNNDSCVLAAMYDAGNKTGGSMLEMLKAYTKTSDFMLKKLGPLN